jgi:hypothetical protein
MFTHSYLLTCPCRFCHSIPALPTPTALLQRAVDANGTFMVEVVVQMRQSPMQRDVVRQLLPQAEASWWAPGHIGWTIFPADSDNFEVGFCLCVSLLLICYAIVLVCMGRFGPVLQARQRPAGGPPATLAGPSFLLTRITLRFLCVMVQLFAVMFCYCVTLHGSFWASAAS